MEKMIDYDKYTQSYDALIGAGMLPPGTPKADENRTLLTSRWTKMLASQTVTLSLFGFYSPSEEDLYARMSVSYRFSDEITVALGGNIFDGADPYTQFGMFERNDNVYMKLTYGL